MMNIKLQASSSRQALKIYLRCLSSMLPAPFQELSASEVDILVEFILLPDKFHWARFSSPAKARVLTQLEEHSIKISRPNLNNKLYGIQDKGYLRKDEDRV